MKDWIEEQRGTILFLARQGLLSTQLCGPLTKWQEDSLDEYVDKLKTDAYIIDENAEERLERYGEDDFLEAYSAEIVSYADDQFVEDLLTKAVGVHSINFSELKEEGEATFVGDHLMAIIDKISDIIDGFPEGENFILCSPLEVSIIQSITRGEFKSITDGWKGLNYCHLVGTLNGVKLYTHLSQVPKNDTIFVGNYDPNTVKSTIHKIALTNLELA